MAFGSKDERGIYKYGEDDTFSNHSTLLNEGMDSVSDALKYFSGTSAEREAFIAPPPGARWQDTDNGEHLHDVGPDGEWRRRAGSHQELAAVGWAASASPVWARSVNITLPVALRATETIAVGLNGSSNYTTVDLAGISRGGSSTDITVRIIQVLNAATAAFRINWWITEL